MGRSELLPRWQVDSRHRGNIGSRTHSAANKIALIDVNAKSAASTRFLVPRPDFAEPFSFTPDGTAVTYNIVEDGVGNVWEQPLDGSPGHRLTNFTSDRIRTFRFSPDGESLAVRASTSFPTLFSYETPPHHPGDADRGSRSNGRQGSPEVKQVARGPRAPGTRGRKSLTSEEVSCMEATRYVETENLPRFGGARVA